MTLVTIQFRRGTATQWNTVNPILALGEPGLDTTVLRLKIGDGVSHWVDLDWLDELATDLQMTDVLLDDSSDFVTALTAMVTSVDRPLGEKLALNFVPVVAAEDVDDYIAALSAAVPPGTAFTIMVRPFDILEGVTS